jgi:hypothetical protein
MDGKVHQAVAVPAGIGVSLFHTHGQPIFGRFVEAAGAGLGASFAARLPDCWDPPYAPCHRALAHSVALAVPATILASAEVSGIQDQLRLEAASHAWAAQCAADPLVRFWHTLCEWFYQFMSGCLVGLVVGYGSHLALDAFTPRSLPLIA